MAALCCLTLMLDEGTSDPIEATSNKRGWHAHSDSPSWTSATVEPIRKRRDIESIKRILANEPRNLTLFIVGIHFGLRGGDLLSLRWRDVMTAARVVRDHVEVTEQKTGKLRVIRVQPNAARALEEWCAIAEPERDDLVFPGRDGERMTIQRLHQLCNEWTERAGIRGNFGSHTLRKTYGYQLRMAGTDIVRLMTIFGHSSPAITLRYLGVEQEELDEANLRLNL